MPAEVKICGLSTPATVEAALAAGAEYLGFVFYPPSPRNVDVAAARSLADLARGKAKIVAVVVDADDEQLERISAGVRPDYLQAHGREDADRVAVMARSTGVPVIKAIRVERPGDIKAAGGYRDAAALLLFDAKAPAAFAGALPGGNGVAFDWSLLCRCDAQRRYMLSGGLTPTNVTTAIELTGAPIVDVSSGVESAPGVKDAELIRKFIAATRNAAYKCAP
jgi:phosphoribosylanthranilate isomerase